MRRPTIGGGRLQDPGNQAFFAQLSPQHRMATPDDTQGAAPFFCVGRVQACHGGSHRDRRRSSRSALPIERNRLSVNGRHMIKIGNIEVTRIEEAALVEQPTSFADFRPELIADYSRLKPLPNHYDEKSNTFIISVHSWLLSARRIASFLIDTASGNGKIATAVTPPEYAQHALSGPAQTAGVAPERCGHGHSYASACQTTSAGIPVGTTRSLGADLSEGDDHHVSDDCARGARSQARSGRKAAGSEFATHRQRAAILDAGTVWLVDGTETVSRHRARASPRPRPGPYDGASARRWEGGTLHRRRDAPADPDRASDLEQANIARDPPLAREARARVLAYCCADRALPDAAGPISTRRIAAASSDLPGGGYTFVPSDETP